MHWAQNIKGMSHSCSCYKHALQVLTNKTCDYLQISMQITSTMMSLNVHIEFQKWKVFLVRDNYATHSLQHVGRGEAFGFVNLKFSNITIFFLPPNLVQPLHQGIIDPFKILYNKKLLE